MTEPRRLLDEPATEAERLLLRSADADGLSPEACQHLVKAILAAAPLTVAVGAATQPANGAGWAGTFKWIALGAGIGVAGVVGVAMFTRPWEHPTPPQLPPPVVVVEAVSTPSAPPAVPAVSDDGKTKEIVAPRASTKPSLADEVRALEQARASLANGSPARALQELDRYHQEFPKGRLRPEATLIRIEALVRQGDRAAARELASRLLGTRRDSPYRARIEALVPELK